ncbi:MAG: ABC transporter ATP-binding protein [Acidimicrobiia bacterium]|nr:ABC transporter ATP-binding protein [Acidimicrobiia bacterium]
MTAALELRDVTREYPGEPPIKALDGVDLRINAGEIVAIVGPSGSGKSTLLNIMGTLDRPTSGEVLIDGIDTASLGDRQRSGLRSSKLGFIFQSFHLLEGARVVDNVANGLLYRGVDRSTRIEKARTALALVGLADRANTRPPKLSGGQRQRVAIARALVGDPTLILADEPTGNLDSRTSDDILRLLEDLNSDHGATIAIITHDLDVAGRVPRQVSVRDGRIEVSA